MHGNCNCSGRSPFHLMGEFKAKQMTHIGPEHTHNARHRAEGPSPPIAAAIHETPENLHLLWERGSVLPTHCLL